MTSKRHRELQQNIEAAGCALVGELSHSGSTHLCAKVRNPHGVERCFHMSLSPSTSGNSTRERAEFKRFARLTEAPRYR